MGFHASIRGCSHRLGSLFILLLVALTAAFALAATAVAAPADTHQAVVEFAAGVSQSEARDIATSHQATLLREIERDGIDDGTHLYCVQSKTRGAEAISSVMNLDADVVFAAPNYVFKAEATPNDPLYTGGEQWALGNMFAPAAWNLTKGSRSVVVAVLDSGTQYTHPDLAANIWTNPGEIAGNGRDDDNNGYVDDVHGIDAVDHDSDPNDGSFHGTYMAGIIGAVGNNGVGMSGVDWQVSIMPVRCLGDDLTGTTAGALEGAWYIIHEKLDHNVNVVDVNTSWGQLNIDWDPLMEQAIAAAGEAGIVWTASAGNAGVDADDELHYPSGYDATNILSVAATDPDDVLASFSNWGRTSVDLAAPGLDIMGTSPGNDYGARSGTSPASANVAGAVALAASLYPAESALQRVDRILTGVDVIPSMAGRTVTGGRLDLSKSLTADLRPTTTLTGVDAAWHKQAVTATFSGSDGTGVGVAYTESSLDGGAYQRGATRTVAGDGSHALSYRSVDKAANTEATKSAIVKVDGTSPTLTADGSGSAWHTAATTMQLQAADATSGIAQLRYALDAAGMTVAPSSSVGVAVTSEGVHTLHAAATDVAGNATSSDFTVKVDTAAPSVSATGADSAWHTSPVTVHLSATDVTSGVSSLEYREGTGGWTQVTAATTEIVVSATDNDGSHVYEYRASDVAGNVSATGTFTVNITTGPALSISGADAAWHSGPVTVSLAGTGPSGIIRIEYRLAGDSTWTEVPGDAATVIVAAEGVSNYEARAVGTTGVYSSVGTFAVKIDTAKPTVGATGADSAWHTSAVTVNLGGTDATSGVAYIEYRLAGSPTWTSIAGASGSVVVSSDGTRDYEYRSIDAAGNVSDIGTFTVKLDVAKPTVGATGADSAWHTGAVTVDLAASDATSGVSYIEYREGTAAWTRVGAATAAVTVSATANDGAHVYEYRAADLAGNVSTSSSFTVKIDTAKPTVGASGADSAWHRTAVTVSLTAADAASGVASIEYRQGTAAWIKVSAATAAVTVSATGNDGAHVYEYRSTDAAGNISTSGSFTVKIDATSPATTVAGADSLWHKAPVTLTFSAGDGAGSGVVRTQYSLNGGSTWTTLLSATLTISAQGTTTVSYRSTDVAGNVEATKSVQVKVDTVAPTTTASTSTARRNRTSSLSYRVSDATPTSGTAAVTSIVVKNLAGTTVSTFTNVGTVTVNRTLTYSFYCNLSVGTYRVTVSATDAAGNVATSKTVGTLYVTN